MLEVYENIKKRRIELGMSQETLAQMVGYYDRSAISKIERGLTDLPLDVLESIANALRTDMVALMGNTRLEGMSNDILFYFNDLNEEGKELAVNMVKGLVMTGQYKKDYSTTMVEEEA